MCVSVYIYVYVLINNVCTYEGVDIYMYMCVNIYVCKYVCRYIYVYVC
jgi:hypothetical protein